MANYKYSKLADWIRERIEDGTYPIGTRIPTEPELAEQFSIGRHTVRRAVEDLEEQGYLHKVQGSGTYVSEKVSEMVPELAPVKNKVVNLVIGLVIGDSRNYIFSEIVQGASEYLVPKGYSLNVAFTGGDYQKEKQVIEALLASNPAGLIIEPANPGILPYNLKLYQKAAAQVPVVLLHSEIPGLCPTISLHDREGARMLTNYLLRMGHREIGTIFAFDEQTGQARYLGLLDALYGHGMKHSSENAIWLQRDKLEDIFQDAGRLALDRMIERVSAIFCHDDRIAYVLINSLRSRGIRVPEDISVVGYDDSFYATLDAQITTVTHPKAEYGMHAAQAVLKLIDDPEHFEAEEYASNPELVIRDTVAYRGDN